ncbi:MAG: LarC family nickel insertion protein, partial [Anaerolineae bacterium]|nr:LarC family nickel insertion protein [Anaerolineae bacterium]
TGAALLTSLADGFGDFPPMQFKNIGIGAGHKQLPFPNVVRVWIGETSESAGEVITETLTMLETNIDDLNPQVYDHIMNQLFTAGALDVSLTSIQMKKNRPGELLSILCHPQDADRLQAILFMENISLGVRRQLCERVSLPRTIESVVTPYGQIALKIASWGEVTRVMPEYEDCRQAAEAHHVPLLEVMASAWQAYHPKAG